MEPAEESRETKLSCRFYEAEYPEVNELVMVEIKDVTEYGTIVKLMEYENIEGMITPNEYTRYPKIKNLMKLRKIGKKEICLVTGVDQENGYIDLSKKRVPSQEVGVIQEKFAKGKMVQAIMRAIFEATKIPVPELYETVVWPLQTEGNHALDIFMQYLHKIDELFDSKLPDISKEVKSKLKSEITRRLKPQPVKVVADFEVTCFAKEGIFAIKEALRAGEACSTDDIKISISLVAPPLYIVSSTTSRKKECFALMEKALEEIKKTIQEKSGSFVLKKKPNVVGKKHEKELRDRIRELNQEEKNEFVHED